MQGHVCVPIHRVVTITNRMVVGCRHEDTFVIEDELACNGLSLNMCCHNSFNLGVLCVEFEKETHMGRSVRDDTFSIIKRNTV